MTMTSTFQGLENILNDLPHIFSWWLALFWLGIIFMPWCARLFKDWPEQGLLFSRPLGLLFCSYSSWFLAATNIFSFGRWQILTILTAITAVTLAFRSNRRIIADTFKHKFRMVAGCELLFLALFLGGIFLRGHKPDLMDLEKFMNLAFVNACLRSSQMPPPDPWFAGATINYYYFGHFVYAWLIQLTAIPADIGYNLAIATIFAMSFGMAFALAKAMYFFSTDGSASRQSCLAAGILAAILTTCSGNMHAFWKWLMPMTGLISASKPFYFADPTRFIGYDPPVNDKTIHEFPLYSFIVSDLHGHLNNLPFVLLFIALLYAGWRHSGGSMTGIPLFPHFVLYGLMFAVFAMTNPWDVPIYILMSIMTIPASRALETSLGTEPCRSDSEGGHTPIVNFLTRAAVIILLFILFSMPFSARFQSFSQGVGKTFSHTPIMQFLTIWGGHLLFALTMIIWHFTNQKKPFEFRKYLKTGSPEDRFCLIMIITALFLLLLPEFVYVKDIYSRSFYRANTMFKFTYQAFILLSLAAGYIIVRVPDSVKSAKAAAILRMAFATTVFSLFVYVIPAVSQRYGTIGPAHYKGLTGLNFLAGTDDFSLQAIRWLQANVGKNEQPVILEANGESYTAYGRISMATGLPTILGWEVHERLWRGNSAENDKRAAHIKILYESNKPEKVDNLISHYNIRYIIVGELEKKKFSKIHYRLFDAFYNRVLSDGKNALYEVKKLQGPAK